MTVAEDVTLAVEAEVDYETRVRVNMTTALTEVKLDELPIGKKIKIRTTDNIVESGLYTTDEGLYTIERRENGLYLYGYGSPKTRPPDILRRIKPILSGHPVDWSTADDNVIKVGEGYAICLDDFYAGKGNFVSGLRGLVLEITEE